MKRQDLSLRSSASELMDDPAAGERDIRTVLRQLEFINTACGFYRPHLRALNFFLDHCHHSPSEPLRVLDIGCGAGGALRRIATWALRRGQTVELTGIDLSPWSRSAALAATPAHAGIRFLTGNIFSYVPEQPFHVAVSSLLAHHLGDPELLALLAWMRRQTRYGWLAHDLRRSRFAYALVRLGTGLLPFHPMIRHDGPLSVTRARTLGEWRRLAAAAGLEPAKVLVRRIGLLRCEVLGFA